MVIRNFNKFYDILVTKKEPQIAHEDNLKSLLSFVELGTDIESEQCLQLAKELEYFYYEHLKPNVKPPFTHFMVLVLIAHVLTSYFFTNAFNASFFYA